MNRIHQGHVYVLHNKDTGVLVIGIRKGIVNYYRIKGSGVIHTLPEEEFLQLYTHHGEKTAAACFDKELEELLKNG